MEENVMLCSVSRIHHRMVHQAAAIAGHAYTEIEQANEREMRVVRMKKKHQKRND